jgi:hypothetical protein
MDAFSFTYSRICEVTSFGSENLLTSSGSTFAILFSYFAFTSLRLIASNTFGRFLDAFWFGRSELPFTTGAFPPLGDFAIIPSLNNL